MEGTTKENTDLANAKKIVEWLQQELEEQKKMQKAKEEEGNQEKAQLDQILKDLNQRLEVLRVVLPALVSRAEKEETVKQEEELTRRVRAYCQERQEARETQQLEKILKNIWNRSNK